MTRDEQIDAAANEAYPPLHPAWAGNEHAAFIQGTEWADANPDLVSRQGAIKNTIEWHANRINKLQAQLAVAVGALREKAKLEPGPRMYENCAAGIALVEIEKLERGEG